MSSLFLWNLSIHPAPHSHTHYMFWKVQGSIHTVKTLLWTGKTGGSTGVACPYHWWNPTCQVFCKPLQLRKSLKWRLDLLSEIIPCHVLCGSWFWILGGSFLFSVLSGDPKWVSQTVPSLDCCLSVKVERPDDYLFGHGLVEQYKLPWKLLRLLIYLLSWVLF